VEVHDTPPPPPPPPPPRLPLKYFGYGALESGPGRRAFLTDGDAVYIVAEGDTVLGRFRIIRITHSSLEFEELVTSRRGVTVLEEERSAP
jgi:Tfp pilus assembly protein PilP